MTTNNNKTFTFITENDLKGKEVLQQELIDLEASFRSHHANFPRSHPDFRPIDKRLIKAIKWKEKRIDCFDERMDMLEREQPILLAHARGTIMDIDPLGGRLNDDTER